MIRSTEALTLALRKYLNTKEKYYLKMVSRKTLEESANEVVLISRELAGLNPIIQRKNVYVEIGPIC